MCLLASVSISRTTVYLTQSYLNTTDIISYTSPLTATPAITKNITQSTDWSESWPVFSNKGELLAYYGVNKDNRTALFIRFPDGTWKNSEVQNASSGLGADYQVELNHPPLWSPNDDWVAFLGRNLHTDESVSELFVMPSGLGEVKRLTDHGHQILSPVWYGNDILIYVELRSDGQATPYQVVVTQPTPTILDIPDFSLPQSSIK